MRRCCFVLLVAYIFHAGCQTPLIAEDRPVAPPMGIGLAGVSSYSSNWQFTDMMKHSREWRTKKKTADWQIIEDRNGWPISLRNRKDNTTAEIDEAHKIFMWLYNRYIAGDVVLTWEGDGEVLIDRKQAKLVTDEFPAKKRRVYHWDDKVLGVFEIVVSRSNPKDHVRNIRLWMPGCEGGAETFHPEWKKIIEPFPFFRFMDWGRTNNSEQKEWGERTLPENMRQTGGVAYEYMLQLANEMKKDAWICIPAKASDDYVRQLARLIKKELDHERRVYVEYSNEIWNPAFGQTKWLWKKAEEEIKTRGLKTSSGRPIAKWEYGADLCGRRSAQIWKIMAEEIEADRIIRTITHFRWLERVMAEALDRKNGEGRVDLISLNGYFISQSSLTYALRDLDFWDQDEAMDMLEQQHLLGKANAWRSEIARVKEKWPTIPVSCYEGGQHFANPFSTGLQGKKLMEKMFAVNADKRIRKMYATALETWHLAGADGFTAFVECGSWSKYGCWGHKQYPTQPLDDVLDPETKELKEKGAHKYAALLDYIKRRSGQMPEKAPSITTRLLPNAVVGKPYAAQLAATGGTPPYRWSLFGGRLPDGLNVTADGTIVGTPTKAEQLANIINCTDSRNQHAARIFGLFIDPAAGAGMQKVDFSQGLPVPWKWLKGKGKIELAKDAAGNPVGVSAGNDIPYLPETAPPEGKDSSYTAEILFSPRRKLNKHQTIGFAFCLSPDGDKEDYLRVAVDGLGHRIFVCSRYVKNSKKELWGRRERKLIRDKGEDDRDPSLDQGEYWKLRATVRPGASPGAIDLLVSVFDQDGKPRIDAADHTDVANGIFLLRELAIKDALRHGPFGILGNAMFIKDVRWKGN